jgi:hypothetical protein
MAVDVADETEGYVDGRSIVNTSRIRQETKKKILILIMGLKGVLISCV